MQERALRPQPVTMRLLAQRVPLTLLLDLLAPPDAQELYRREGGRLDLVAERPLVDLES